MSGEISRCGIAKDSDIAQDLQRQDILFMVGLFVEFLQLVGLDGLYTNYEIAQADVVPLLHQFRMLADMIRPAIAGYFLPDTGFFDSVRQLLGVFGVCERVVIAEVDIRLLHALQVGDDFRYRALAIEAEICGQMTQKLQRNGQPCVSNVKPVLPLWPHGRPVWCGIFVL